MCKMDVVGEFSFLHYWQTGGLVVGRREEGKGGGGQGGGHY